MKESKFLGALLSSSPDFLSIVEAIRKKYKLPEISPDEEPIEEIYLRIKQQKEAVFSTLDSTRLIPFEIEIVFQ